MNHLEEAAPTPLEPEPSPPRLRYRSPRLEDHGTWQHVIGISLPIGELPMLEEAGSGEKG